MRLNNMNQRPGLGIGVYIKKDNKILFGQRKGAHGQGTWCPPGGHVEFGETLEQAAVRETLEEVGIKIKNIKQGPITEDFFKVEKKHYITIALIADYAGGEAELKEPDKFEQWDWFEWDQLPQPLFLPSKNLVETNFNPFK